MNQKASELPLTPQANEQVREYNQDFAKSLVEQAQILAYGEELDDVSARHINQAYNIITKRPKRAPWQRHFLFFGGTITGSAVLAFADAVSNDKKVMTVVSAIFVVLGVIAGILGGLRPGSD